MPKKGYRSLYSGGANPKPQTPAHSKKKSAKGGQVKPKSKDYMRQP